MNPIELHTINLNKANSWINKTVISKRPGIFDNKDNITGIVVSVRETITDYNNPFYAEILVDIQLNGTVTPCYFKDTHLTEQTNEHIEL